MTTTHRTIGRSAHGEDVERLQHFADVRLDRRGQDSYKCATDGANGKQTARAVWRAAYCMGVGGDALANARKGVYSKRLQRVIINPDLRTPQEENNARKRMDKIREAEREAEREPRGPAGLTERQRKEARQIARHAAMLGVNHAGAIHYTMGASRWQGIQRTDYSGQGQYPNYADCSAFATWVLWNALKVRFGVKDIVNGADWLAGYTGTLLTHGVLVAKGRAGKLDLSKLVVGDLIIYGHGWPGTHVAIYVGGGMVVSHGSEGGPYYVRYDYRSDIMEARRYI